VKAEPTSVAARETPSTRSGRKSRCCRTRFRSSTR
jgi:hypothetical protein